MPVNISKAAVEGMVPDFSVVPSHRTRSNGHKLQHRKFDLNIRKNFTLRVAGHLHTLPSQAVESPSPETSKHTWAVSVSPAP